MKNSLLNFDVVIVGFGPVGQFTANLLNQYNLKIAVIEKSKGICLKPKANVLDDEIMRNLSRFRNFADFKKKTSVPEYIEFTFPNKKIIQSNPVKKSLNGFPLISMFHQPDLENNLSENIKNSKNINIFYEEELIDFKQKNNQISITTSSSDKKNNRILKSRFLLACDGVDSFVRTRLNIDQMDLQYNKDWLIIDIKLNKGITLDKVARQICDPNRPTVFMHAPEGRHRFEFQLLAGEDSIEMKSNNSVYKFLSPWLDSSQYTIERSEVYKFRGKKANQWKVDNIFLLGDAAHQMPPYAGQGINSGIRDSINICWKLHMVINHSLNPIMLESYQIEREIHVEETIKSSIALGKLIDSLSIAYKKNIPISDAVAPEARDQAYGGRKANPSEDINPGIYLNSLGHKFTGRLIPNCRLKNDKSVDVNLDSEINGQIAIIGEGNIDDYLDHDTVSLFKKLNTKFINILDYSFKNTDLREMIKVGFILVRPDFHIYGVTDSEHNLQELAEQFFVSICINK